ncbi:retinol dehydrogenase 16 [Patella vulgata]|uniref:retinol dehydrogenase 16 n=1 Tax=Patella vulgata TaxID=6465 RepID=UPI0024A87163|nr:retinol dehydrogenase 16 [Patella vulgata]
MILWVTVLIGYFTLKWFLGRLKVNNYGVKYVLITGCDTGFGNLLAKRLDGLGFHVIAACLKQDAATELKKTSSEHLQTLQLDVSSEDDIKSALTKVKSILPSNRGLWAVVNNAGIGGTIGPIECLNRKDYMDTLAVNLLGLIDVTKMFLPLIRKERGRVVNIASIIGRIALVPTPYCVSKYGVEAFSDSLRREVYHQGIKVSILEPGYFNTEILNAQKLDEKFQDAFNQGDSEFRQYYGQEFIDQSKMMIKQLREKSSSNLFEVIDAYEHAITARYPKSRYILGNDAKYFFRLLWTIPEWMSDFIICFSSPRPKGSR